MKISLCGLGEPLINPPPFIGGARHRSRLHLRHGVQRVQLLSEEKGRRLLDVGLKEIDINVGEEGEEYERIYGLPFEKTRATSSASQRWPRVAARSTSSSSTTVRTMTTATT